MAMIVILGLLVTVALFVPVGLFLQWALPVDIPYPYYELAFSLCSLAFLTIVLLLLGRRRRVARRGAGQTGRLLVVCLLVLLGLTQVFIFVPQIGRRIGPWADLRSLLLQKAQEVEDARVELGIPANRYLTAQERERIEAMVFAAPEEFTFPLINKKVTLRMMSTEPPYVGVDYGSGRRVIFDLDSMTVIYAD